MTIGAGAGVVVRGRVILIMIDTSHVMSDLCLDCGQSQT